MTELTDWLDRLDRAVQHYPRTTALVVVVMAALALLASDVAR